MKRLIVALILLASRVACLAGVSTLDRTVMVGYQGWFRTPDDGAGMGWAHYQRSESRDFSPSRLAIDYWPDMTEYTPAERHPTPLAEPDGSPATVFSSHNPLTVDRHFGWMAQYGIDGAFVQRFPGSLISADARSALRRRAADDVLVYAARAAEHHGRSFALMYDLSGLPVGAMGRVEADWRRLVVDLHIRQSPAYQHHRGKPVVAIWGVGFNDGRAYTLPEVMELVDFLKHDPQCGGNTVMLGIPSGWREQTGDSTHDARLHAVLAQADILSPWTPGRYDDLGGVRLQAERVWLPDRAWCAARGLDYMPVVFPGFRWQNLHGAKGGIDRLDGRFLWEQYRQLANGGVTMVYQAMFDEMNEGTQIFKVSDRPPAGVALGSYRPLPSDQYLWLVGLATQYLRRGETFPERIPLRGQDRALDRHLRAGDTAVYAQAAISFAAQKRFLAIADELTAHASDWSPDGDAGARVRAVGGWPGHFGSTRDPAAGLEWELPVPAPGDYTIAIRYPGDPNEDHATAARLSVRQGDRVVAEAKVNLRVGGLRWNELPRVHLAAAAPCRVSLAAPVAGSADGGLVLFEARLAPLF